MPAADSLSGIPDRVTSVPLTGLDRVRRSTLAAVRAIGASTWLVWACVRALRYPRIYIPLTFAQVWELGVASVPLVLGRATTLSVVVATVTLMVWDLILARLLRVFG